nr:MAG TPA: hypothetical protein [Caudoviricetes sp.]
MSIKAYKGFKKKDMTCNGFQYEEGKEYQAEGKIELCKNGFHACEDPLDCFRYYPPATSVFHEVEQDGEIYNNRNGDDSKTVSSQIKIGANIGIKEIVKAHCDYVKAHITTEHTDPKKATAGDSGAATAGSYGAATAGDFGAAAAGSYGAATAGDKGAATAGNFGAATAGSYGAATAGDFGIASSLGSVSVGIKALAVCRSNHPKARGKLGAILVVAVENQNKEIAECKVGTVDNEQLMEDRWYTVKNGAWVEAEVD